MVLVVLFILNTCSFIKELNDVQNDSVVVHTDEKNVETETKEVEKVVNGKTEKTKEVKTVEKSDEPKGFIDRINKLFDQKTVDGVWTRSVFRYFVILIGYWMLAITVKGVGNVSFLGFGVSSGGENNSQTLEKIDNQRTKLDIIKHFSTLGNQKKFSDSVEDKTLLGYLTAMFKQMQNIYDEQFRSAFDFEILTMDEFLNSNKKSIVKKSIAAVNDFGCGVSIGKEENLPFHQNFLMYKVSGVVGNEVKEYVILLSSYNYEFDEDDEIVIATLCSIVATVHKTYTQSVVLLEFNRRLMESAQTMQRENQIRNGTIQE